MGISDLAIGVTHHVIQRGGGAQGGNSVAGTGNQAVAFKNFQPKNPEQAAGVFQREFTWSARQGSGDGGSGLLAGGGDERCRQATRLVDDDGLSGLRIKRRRLGERVCLHGSLSISEKNDFKRFLAI